MPTFSEHLKKAEHNEGFYLSYDLLTTPYLDWVVTGVFYSALHYIESYFATQDKHSPNHGERLGNIENDPNLGLYIYNKFRGLKDDGHNSRYLTNVFTPGEIQQSIIPNLTLIKEHLHRYIPQIRLA